jgi:hypothetical protein
MYARWGVLQRDRSQQHHRHYVIGLRLDGLHRGYGRTELELTGVKRAGVGEEGVRGGGWRTTNDWKGGS